MKKIKDDTKLMLANQTAIMRALRHMSKRMDDVEALGYQANSTAKRVAEMDGEPNE